MSLEPYGPAAALIGLALLTVVAFLWARAVMRRQAPAAEPESRTAERPPEPESRTAERPPEPPPASAPPAQAPAPRVPEYVMAAPVELWFGETRVVVRAGSPTERRFLEFGAALLEELEAARDTSEVMRRRESPDILR